MQKFTEELMKKKKKVNKRKLYSRIFLLICIIILIIIFINIFSKEEKTDFSINVILNGEDITSKLSKNPYIDKDNVLYLSLEDVRSFLDRNIYYEEVSNKIITTSETKVVAINIEDNTIDLNSVSRALPVRNIELWR